MTANQSKKFYVLDTEDRSNDELYNNLYEMYKSNVLPSKLAEFGINDLDDFKNMFIDDESIQSLLDELTEENKMKFMQYSVVKEYLPGGRNRKRRSKKRRGNRRKSTRRRSRR
jgi:hypothetical protein